MEDVQGISQKNFQGKDTASTAYSWSRNWEGTKGFFPCFGDRRFAFSVYKQLQVLYEVLLKSFQNIVCILVAVGVSGYMLYNVPKMLQRDAIDIAGKLVLLISADAISYESGRKMLKQFCKAPGVESIIPLCVLEKLLAEARVNSDIRAMATVLMIKEQMKLGAMRLQYSCEEALWMSQVSGTKDSLPYEERMVNSAYLYSRMRADTTVLLVTNSKVLKVLAMAQNIRCIHPQQLSRINIYPPLYNA